MKTKEYLKENLPRCKRGWSRLQRDWPLILLFCLALITRISCLAFPPEVVFDEVHFGKFVSAYSTNSYYFDIHPPLGKMMIAGFANLAGLNLGNEDSQKIFSQIGNQINSRELFILRLLPAVFGASFVVLIYQLILAITLSKKPAFFGAFLVLFDTSFLAQSKFILVDIFLLFFGFSSLYFFILSRKRKEFPKKSILFLAISAVFAGLSLSIKWTGLSFWGIIMVWLLIDFLRKRPFGIKKVLIKTGFFIIIPFLVYFFVFALHFKILYKSGSGNAYMSRDFQKTLTENNVKEDVKPLNLWQKFTELNSAMYRYNKGIKTSHPYSSKWYQWPLGKKAIWYWQEDNLGEKSNIYLLANPIIWKPVLWTIFLTPFLLIFSRFRKKLPKEIYILYLGYWANLLPYIFVSRVTFLYHYLPSLTFGIIIFSLLAGIFLTTPLENKEANEKKPKKKPKKGFLGFPSGTIFFFYFGYLFLVLAFFLLLYPLCYGFPVPLETLEFYKGFIN